MSGTPFVATLIAPTGELLSPNHIDSFSQRVIVSGGKVDKTTSLANGQAADVFFADALHVKTDDLPFDVLLQPVVHRRKKILIADMESTIIEQEMLDEMAAEIGIGEKVAEITRRAMNGEMDFKSALKERVNLLKNQPESLLYHVADCTTLMPGAQALVSAMKKDSAHCWLVSGGFTFFVKKIADQLGFDRFFANELVVENGLITGEVKPPILDKNSKKTLLEQACADYGCTLAETVAVGDGANDVPMLQACTAGGGLGVAFHAKPKVREIITNQINHSDLTALIYAQGLDL